MKIRSISAALAAGALLVLPAQTPAQSKDLNGIPGLSYSSATSNETWRTVMLVSGILLVIGLAGDNSALVLVGGAGVLVALVQSGGNMYRAPSPNGLEVGRVGPFKLGVSAYGQGWRSPRTREFQPSLVLQTTVKL